MSTKPNEFSEHIGLCHRCEHRARWFENEHRPRYECGLAHHASCSCYMYRPVQPVVLRRDESELALRNRRPVGGPWLLAARMSGVGMADKFECVHRKMRGGRYVFYWRPKVSGKRTTFPDKKRGRT